MRGGESRGAGGRLRSSDGNLDAVLDDASADCVPGQTRGVMDVQLGHQVLAVLVHGLEADPQLLRDLLVGFAFGDQLEHLDLTRTQAGDLRPGSTIPIKRFLLTFVKVPGDGGAKEIITLVNFPDRFRQEMG